jgi:hypothetical protein
MKYLPILTLMALSALYVAPDTRADTKPCNCNCQCAASPINPSNVAGVTAITVPAPQISEVINGELDLRALGGAEADVNVAYPDIANGHTVGLFWTSDTQQYRAPVQTVRDGARSLIFKIPNATVSNDLGHSPKLTASVGVAGNPLVISAPLEFKVVNSTPSGEFPQPTLPGSPGNQVDIGALADDLTVSVHYPSMAQNQIVKVFWEGTGVTPYATPLRLVPNTDPMEFKIPKAIVIASLGKPVVVTYETAIDGQQEVRSDPASLRISLLTLPDAPSVPLANGVQLDLRTLGSKDLPITLTYPGIASGHTAGIRWAGNPPYDTPHPPIGETPRPLQFTIPYSKVRQEKGNSVDITASVGVGDDNLAVSPKLSLTIVDTRPTGEQIAGDLNARYNDTRPVCDDSKPAYYCSGIALRATVNGDYDPWNPSPSGERVGGVSFSYMRKDTYITDFLYNSGFLLFDQDDAVSQDKELTYLCIYAYDSWTLHGNTDKGCGFKPKAADLSSCASVGVFTADQWYAYTQRLTHQKYQCSLSTADPAQFYTSIQVRARTPALPTPIAYGYNELMIGTWPQNIGAQLPIQAFFYKINAPTGNPAAALAEAKVYQTKYMQRTQIWVPVIKVDLKRNAENPFSYAEADQAIQQ